MSELDPLTAAGILSGLARNAYVMAVEHGMSRFSAFELARAVELAHLSTSKACVETARNPFLRTQQLDCTPAPVEALDCTQVSA